MFSHNHGLSRIKQSWAKEEAFPVLFNLRKPQRLSFRTKLLKSDPRKYVGKSSLSNRSWSAMRNDSPSGTQQMMEVWSGSVTLRMSMRIWTKLLVELGATTGGCTLPPSLDALDLPDASS
mmetsp:Transcript_24317/g.34833  ORF Transcript_24317/g.34833 Transcript_24317/m.34833 type:complete len:120 (+) Transcript_24317:537-896(+)